MGNRKYKSEFWKFWASVSGILLGGWMIFKYHNNWGFIPALVGFIALLWKK